MLVLARQLNERIVMPTVPATIEIVAIKTGGVRLGIDAPPEVTILREEVLRRGSASPAAVAAAAGADAETCLGRVKHVLRNRLHTVAVGLDLLRQQLETSAVPGLEAMLRRMEGEVRTLDQQLRSVLAGSSADRPEPAVVVSCLETAEGGLAI
jgi:carbon storage regulator